MEPMEFALIGLAAFRITKLFVNDTILDGPRIRFLKRFPYEGMPTYDGTTGTTYGHEGTFLGELISCPWCLGFWVSVVAWGVFELSPEWAVRLSIPWALSAAVGLLGDRS